MIQANVSCCGAGVDSHSRLVQDPMSRFHMAKQRMIPDMLLVCALSDYSGIVGPAIPKKDDLKPRY